MKKEDYLEIPELETFLQIRNVEAQQNLRELLHHTVKDKMSDRKPARYSQNAIGLTETEERKEDERFRWQELANAIIIQAAEDWREAAKYLRKHPASREAAETVRETESFFLSEYYAALSEYDGQTLLRRLKEECSTCRK